MTLCYQFCRAALLAAAVALIAEVRAEFADPAWRYTTKEPAADWQTIGFDDSSWKTGFGGFGDPSTRGSRVSTAWYTPAIWMRRTITLESVPAEPALLIHHDEDAEVFINGVKAASFTGFITEFRVHTLDAAAKKLLKAGENQVAVHCRQTGGGQSIDVHVVDANAVPKLPAPKRPDRPFESDLITAWGAQVTPENAWREYPRPQLVRDAWTNLNGSWAFAITPILNAEAPRAWDGEILVPFAVESKLSRVQRLLHHDQALWYTRELEAQAITGHRTVLHFEACDYKTTCWVKGIEVGQHTGGNLPFSFDITEALADGEADGPTTLLVRVEDATGDYQLRGKQNVRPHGISGGRGVSFCVPGVWWRHPADRVHHRARADSEDPDTPRRTARAAARVSRPRATRRLGRARAGPRRPGNLSGTDRRTARDRHPQPLTGSHATVRTAREKGGFKTGLR